MRVNFRERVVYQGIKENYNDIVGGFINTTWDNELESEEYKSAVAFLNDKELVVETIYRSLTTTNTIIALSDCLMNIKQDIRFLGKTKIMEMIENYVNKHLENDIKEIRKEDL